MRTGGLTVARNVSAAVVAAIAAWSSYSHMVQVALRFGESPEVAYALPFSVDGMLVVATIAMADDKRRHRRPRPMTRIAFAAGVLASVAANVAGAHPGIGSRIVAAWPAIALLLVVEMLARPAPPGEVATNKTAAEVTTPVDIGLMSVIGSELEPAIAAPMSKKPVGRRHHRPVAETRCLADQLMHSEPHLTRSELAGRLGLSTRRLREILAS